MIKSYSPNVDNLKLSLSKLMAGRNTIRTAGIGTKRGKIRIKSVPKLGNMAKLKIKPVFPSHQFTGGFQVPGGSGTPGLR